MPAKRTWTDSDTETLRKMTSEGISSPVIAHRLGVSEGYIRNQRQRFCLELPPHLARRNAYLKPPVMPVVIVPETKRTEAFPPGHPETWGPITRGTCLEGVPYGT